MQVSNFAFIIIATFSTVNAGFERVVAGSREFSHRKFPRKTGKTWRRPIFSRFRANGDLIYRNAVRREVTILPSRKMSVDQMETWLSKTLLWLGVDATVQKLVGADEFKQELTDHHAGSSYLF